MNGWLADSPLYSDYSIKYLSLLRFDLILLLYCIEFRRSIQFGSVRNLKSFRNSKATAITDDNNKKKIVNRRKINKILCLCNSFVQEMKIFSFHTFKIKMKWEKRTRYLKIKCTWYFLGRHAAKYFQSAIRCMIAREANFPFENAIFQTYAIKWTE